jgi:hypothetical protein
LFDAARHEPYRMLVDQFNVYSSFQPSQQAAMPVGHRSIPSDIGNLPAGSPFPIENFKESLKSGMYMVRDLTRVVGLPMFCQNRDQATMLALRDAQGVTAPVSICDDPATPPSPLDHSRVDADTFAKWRGQQVAGVYDAP